MSVAWVEAPQFHDRVHEARERSASARAGRFKAVAFFQVMNEQDCGARRQLPQRHERFLYSAGVVLFAYRPERGKGVEYDQASVDALGLRLNEVDELQPLQQAGLSHEGPAVEMHIVADAQSVSALCPACFG